MKRKIEKNLFACRMGIPIALACLFIQLSLHSQKPDPIQITGKVIDSETREPLEYATLVL